MTIGITLNEVLRDFIGQLIYTYNKYEIPPEEADIELEDNPVTNWNLLECFDKFKNVVELNTFLYTEASLEIFGHADQLHENVITKLNRFTDELLDEEEHDIVLISREADKSIPATFFFLSKLGYTGNNIRFVQDTVKKWDYCDVLITANPKALDVKPEGKIAIKVNAPYNEDSESDYDVDTIMDLFDNEDFNKILEND
jgi:hypothetical protein